MWTSKISSKLNLVGNIAEAWPNSEFSHEWQLNYKLEDIKQMQTVTIAILKVFSGAGILPAKLLQLIILNLVIDLRNDMQTKKFNCFYVNHS